MGVCKGDTMGICHHLEIGTKNQKFLENLSQQLNWLNSCNDSFIFRYDTDPRQEPGTLLWYHAILSFQFTHICYIICRGRMRNFSAVSSKIGLHCVTVTWQQRFTLSCDSRGLAARDYWRHLWQVMQRDNDCWLQLVTKSRPFIRCEKKPCCQRSKFLGLLP